MSALPCSWTVLRVVPHPHTGEGWPVGVVLQSRPAAFLGIRLVPDTSPLRSVAPHLDLELLTRYLDTYRGVAAGEADAGPIALLSAPERFYWMAAPRSDVLQPSPVEHGSGPQPEELLDALFQDQVARNTPWGHREPSSDLPSDPCGA